jgi:serine phosphatase RsbU (regulator of sigma subunit)
MNGEESFHPGIGLKTKFLLWLVLFILLIMSSVYLFVTRHERRILSAEVKLRGEAICSNLAAGAEDFLVMKDDLALAKLVTDTKEKNQGVLSCAVIDTDRTIWAHTDISRVGTRYETPPGFEELGGKNVLTQDYVTPDGIRSFVISMPVSVAGAKLGEVYVLLSQETIRSAVAQARRGIGMVTGAVMAVGIAAILLLVSLMIGSLADVSRDIRAIGEGDLERDIRTQRSDEIGSIAFAVKMMAHKLKKARAELIEKERMRKEMEVARDIQQALLPRTIPDIRGFEIESYYQAAMELGGDYYDFITIDESRFGVVVADVSGKGVGGSLIMNMVRTIMRTEAMRNPAPRHLLSIANYFLKDEIPQSMFITLFYVLVDANSNVITYACAGHNPGFLLNPERRALIQIKPKGIPLGIHLFDERQFAMKMEEESKRFNPGDILFLYTDGITEAMNSRKELFGEQRLIDVLKRNGVVTPQSIKDSIRNELDSFTGKEPQSDDITFVILQRKRITSSRS